MPATVAEVLQARGGQWKRFGRTAALPGNPDPAWIPYWGTPAWADEFTAASINAANWVVRDRATHGNLSYDWGNITAANAFVSAGKLVMRTSQRATPYVGSDGRNRWFDTCYLDTKPVTGFAGHADRFGRWEMRAKIPTIALQSNGVWPAFWLRNGNVGEIDIMESWGDPPSSRVRSATYTETSALAIHESTNGGLATKNWSIETQLGSPPFNTAQGFHTWALEYTPARMSLLFDGQLAVEITPATYPWVWGATFNSPWHIRLSAQMGDNYWSQAPVPDGTRVMPADFVIDHIRYWALPA